MRADGMNPRRTDQRKLAACSYIIILNLIYNYIFSTRTHVGSSAKHLHWHTHRVLFHFAFHPYPHVRLHWVLHLFHQAIRHRSDHAPDTPVPSRLKGLRDFPTIPSGQWRGSRRLPRSLLDPLGPRGSSRSSRIPEGERSGEETEKDKKGSSMVFAMTRYETYRGRFLLSDLPSPIAYTERSFYY